MYLPLDPKTKLNSIVEASNQSLRDWIFSHLPTTLFRDYRPIISNRSTPLLPRVCSSWRSLCNTGGELVPDKFHGSHRSGKNHDGSWNVFHTSSDVHVLRTPFLVHTIILVWYITLHTLLFSGINLFDLLCIFFFSELELPQFQYTDYSLYTPYNQQ